MEINTQKYSCKKAKLYLAMLLCLFSLISVAQITSVVSGSWNVTVTWGGPIPTSTDSVVIAPTHTVTLAGSVTCAGIKIYGILNHVIPGRNLTLNAFGPSFSDGIHYYLYGEHQLAGASVSFTRTFGAANIEIHGTGVITGTGSLKALEARIYFASDANITLVDADILTATNPNFQSFFNYGKIVLVNGNFTLSHQSFVYNYGEITLTNGSWDWGFQGGCELHNEVTGKIRIINMDMSLGAGAARVFNDGDITLENGSMRFGGSGGSGNTLTNYSTGTINILTGDLLAPSPTVLRVNNSGKITVYGNINIRNTSANQYTNNSNSVLNVGGSLIATAAYFRAYAKNNTVNYFDTTDQTIFTPQYSSSLNNYYHLKCSNSGIKTTTDSLSILGNLTIRDTAQLDVTTSNYHINLKGNWYDSSIVSNPFLERNGTVTFSGDSAQVIVADSIKNETFYNLTLNDTGTVDNYLNIVTMHDSVSVLDTLNLTDGVLNLNTHVLTIVNSLSSSLIGGSDSAFIKSETSPAQGYSFADWKIGNSVGNYRYPFGKSGAINDYIPVTFNITTAGDNAGSIAVATYGTTTTNTVYPSGVTNVNRNGLDNSTNIVDRFWIINSSYTLAPIVTFTLTAPTSELDNIANPRAQRWNTTSQLWEFPLPNQTYSITATGVSVSVPNFKMISSPWTIADNNHLLSTKPTVTHSPNATICFSARVTLTAFGTNAVYYSWSPTVSLTTLSLTAVNNSTLTSTGYYAGNNIGFASVIATPTITTTYTLIISNNSGIDTSYITVTVPQEIIAIIQSANTSICSGESYPIASKSNISTPEHYIWNPTTALNNATVYNPVASPQATTTYTLTIEDDWGCYNTNMVTQLIHVEINPTLTVSAPITICNGTDTTLAATVLGGSLLWSTNSTNTSIIISPDTTTTYVAFATNSYCQPKQFIKVTVISLPTVSAGNDAFMCVGAATGTALNGTGSGIPVWSPNTYLSSNATLSTNANPPQIGIYHYTLTITESNGCSGYDGVILRVDTLLIINAGSDLTICSGIATILNSTITAGANIVWSPATALTSNTINSPTLTPIAIEVPTLQLLNYTITVSAPGCNDEKDYLTIQVLQSPILATNNVSICIGTTPTLNVSGADSYLWSDNSTLSTITPFLSASTNYTVLGTNNNGCTDTNTVQITVHTLPPVDAGSNITASTALRINLNGSGASIYLWSPKESLSDTNIYNPLITNRITKKYNLIGTDKNGCVNEDSVYIKYIVCDDVFVPDAFSPNADNQNDELEVIVEDSQCIQALNFQIYDRWGTKVFETTNPEIKWDGRYKNQELTDAVFVYRIDIKNVDDKDIVQKGNLSLIR